MTLLAPCTRPNQEYAGVRLGDVRNPGPAECQVTTHWILTRDELASTKQETQFWGAKTPSLEGCKNLPSSSAADPSIRPTSMPSSRRPAQRPRHQSRRSCLRCTQCGTDAQASVGNSDSGLSTHMSQKHGEQVLDTIGSRRGNRCNQYRAGYRDKRLGKW